MKERARNKVIRELSLSNEPLAARIIGNPTIVCQPHLLFNDDLVPLCLEMSSRRSADDPSLGLKSQVVEQGKLFCGESPTRPSVIPTIGAWQGYVRF